ncbi:hypothetical protein [Polaribacter glomeratus]|uniref:Uncharacterized protein n=1 Tax=Polaribacter glomeratus TaxID=102 RepID=A0A2S7WYF2_9FLAO|nr:hypothetical protein [Polaribacter glomeratus]PQJ82614.1 hypothetical protein BTO16_08510 [Polaribacter glomeratus]TXD64930.1 hypothetical protein ESX12_12355 [Polaribacter glomeratus]
MENKYPKIANIKLKISVSCSEENKEIIKLYWELKGIELSNSPRQIKEQFKLSQSELTKLNTTYSKVLLYLFCSNCNSYEKHEAKSQSRFNEAIKKQNNRYSTDFKCSYCEEEEVEALKIQKIKKHNDLLLKLDAAIENKNWKRLSNFEKLLLGNCLIMDFYHLKKHYGGLLGHHKFIELIRALENIEDQYLILLDRDSFNNYITNYRYVSRLREYKEEIIFVEEEIDNSIDYDKETNTLKLKLTITENQQYPDSPKFSGVVKFKERIVIEPNVDYVFGLWQRANNNLYLTLTPQENIDILPTQKRISKLPISVQKAVTDFLNNMSKNF